MYEHPNVTNVASSYKLILATWPLLQRYLYHCPEMSSINDMIADFSGVWFTILVEDVLFKTIVFSVFSEAASLDPVIALDVIVDVCDVGFAFSFNLFGWVLKFPESEVLPERVRSVWFLFEFGYVVEDKDNVGDGYFDEEFEPLMDPSDFPECPIENTELVFNAPCVFCPCVDVWGDLELDAESFFCEFDCSADELEL